MKTININYNDGQWLVYTAEKEITLTAAMNAGRSNMPDGASRFRIVLRNGHKSAWMR